MDTIGEKGGVAIDVPGGSVWLEPWAPEFATAMGVTMVDGLRLSWTIDFLDGEAEYDVAPADLDYERFYTRDHEGYVVAIDWEAKQEAVAAGLAVLGRERIQAADEEIEAVVLDWVAKHPDEMRRLVQRAREQDAAIGNS